MKKRLLLTLVITSIFISTISAITSSIPVAAAAADTPILRKALMEGIRNCYTTGKMKADLGIINNYGKFSDLLQSKGGSGYIQLPNSYTNISDNGINCEALFLGDTKGAFTESGSFEGIFALAGITPPTRSSTSEAKEEFLTNMGYVKTSATPGQCISFNYAIDTFSSVPGASTAPQNVYTHKLCAPVVNSDGTIGADVSRLTVIKDGDSVIEFEIGNKSVQLDCATSGLNLSKGGCQKHSFEPGVTKWSDFSAAILRDISVNANEMTSASGDDNSLTVITYKLEDNVRRSNYGDDAASYAFNDSNREAAANKAIAYLSEFNNRTDLRYTEEEEFVLYQTYLNEYYGATIHCDLSGDELTIIQAQGKPIRAYVDGQVKDDCYAIAKRNQNNQVNGLTDSRYFPQKRSFNEIAAILNKTTIRTIANPGDIGNIADDAPTNGTNPSGTTDPGDGDPCFTGAEATGWILCPVLKALGNTARDIYEKVLAPFLSIDARLFTEDGTYTAWSTFQAIANIAFIILLLVVIFSQITGIGIDNYGIKKILPKLIISAILINLSYIICRLAIDVSNILGYSINSIFDSVANSIKMTPGTFAVPPGVNFATGLISVVAVVAGVTAIATGGFAILIPLLLGVISVVIAIVFTFILLGAREAGVVLLTVLAPLAVVSYMLPNTKKIFDRWRKMFTGLILLFPICGLLIGGGGLASRIIISADPNNFYTALTAMLINIVPLFFIPSLLKASFAAMGNIGAKISGIGQGLKGKATGAVKGSERVKNFQRDQRIKGSARMAKLGGAIGGAVGGTKVGGFLFNRRGQRTSRARALAAADEMRAKDASAESRLLEDEARGWQFGKATDANGNVIKDANGNDTFRAGDDEHGVFGAQYRDALKSGNISRANAILASYAKRSSSSTASKLVRSSFESPEGQRFAQKPEGQSFMRMLEANHASVLGKDPGLQSFIGARGLDATGNFRGVKDDAWYTDQKPLKASQVGQMSGAAITAAMKAGAIDATTAQQVLSNANVTQNMDKDGIAQLQGLVDREQYGLGVNANAAQIAAAKQAAQENEASLKIVHDSSQRTGEYANLDDAALSALAANPSVDPVAQAKLNAEIQSRQARADEIYRAKAQLEGRGIDPGTGGALTGPPRPPTPPTP